MVDGEVRFLEVRRHLELRRRNFVVSSRDWHPELVELELDFRNTALDALGNSSEVVIFELLTPRRRGADECAPAHHQIRAHSEKAPIDEEVFLLGSKGRVDALHSPVSEKLEQLD